MRASRLLTASAGFLLAVLWMDLMFDVQVAGVPTTEAAPPAVLASISAYYRRVTTDASPMHVLVAAMMFAGIGGALVEGTRGDGAAWRRLLTVALIAAPVALAFARVFPNAVRLGTAVDTPLVQTDLARAIWRDHVACFASITTLLVLRMATPRK